ncbi:ZBED1 protein, partial [Amia calva]|nr:ZBED1 protein [Amia calva]
HQLITQSPTKWGSRQKMIEQILEQEKARARVLGSEKKTRHLVHSWQDIDLLESVNKAIGSLQKFTDALSGENYVSVSYLKPVLNLFNRSLLQPEEDENELTKKIKSATLQYLKEKYEDPATVELIDMATLVDPQFRTTYIADDKIESIKHRAVLELKSLLAEESTHHPGTTVCQEEESEPVSKKGKKTLASFFKKTELSGPQPSPHHEQQAIASELLSYLQLHNLDSEEDPLDWWREHQRLYPRLSKLAKKYLCIPATSSPSERVFSTGGNIATCHRLVFLSRNL